MIGVVDYRAGNAPSVGHSGAGVWEVSGFRELAPRERFITVYPDGLPVSFTRGERTFSGLGWEIRTFAPNRDIDFTIALALGLWCM